MKKITVSLLITCLIAITAAGCSAPQTQTPPPQNHTLTLSSKSVDLDVGEYRTLVATTTATEDIIWETANSAIVTVTADGVLYGVAEGETTVTASCGTLSESAIVSVTSDVITPSFDTLLALSCYESHLKLGESATVTAWLEYADGKGAITDIKVSYLSSDEGIVSVDSAGKFTAQKPGSAVVYVATKYQQETYLNSVTVRVTDPEGVYLPDEGIALLLESSDLYVKVGESAPVVFRLMNGEKQLTVPNDAVSVTVKTGANVVEVVAGEFAVKGLSAGNATVEVSVTYGTNTYRASFHVGVSR